jgi:hypothetical protein
MISDAREDPIRTVRTPMRASCTEGFPVDATPRRFDRSTFDRRHRFMARKRGQARAIALQ